MAIHSSMPIVIESVSIEKFLTWIEEQKSFNGLFFKNLWNEVRLNKPYLAYVYLV